MATKNWTGAFLLCWAVWGGGMAVGYAVVDWTKHLPRDLPALVGGAAHTDAAGGGKVAPTAEGGRSALELFAFIWGRNFTVYVWLLAGLLSAGAITFLVLLANGVILGQTIGFAADAGLPPADIANLLLPHGALELGIFCIAGAVGFQGLGLALDWARLRWQSLKSLRLGLVLAFGAAALAVAAGVETVVTGALAESIGYANGR